MAAEIVPVREGAARSEFLVTFPSPLRTGIAANDRAAAFYFPPQSPGPHPAVLILHALGSRRAGLEKWIAREFAKRDMAALLLVLPHHMMRKGPGGLREAIRSGDAEAILTAGRQGVLDLRRALDWLETRAEIAPDRLAVLGLSLGAIEAAIALGVEERLKAGVLILGGADPAHLVWSSPLAWPLRRRFERQGLTETRLRERWRAIDPATFAEQARRKPVYMVNARFDWVLPRECSELLWEALGRPAIDWLPTDHYLAYFYRGQILEWAHAFLRDALRLPAPQRETAGSPPRGGDTRPRPGPVPAGSRLLRTHGK